MVAAPGPEIGVSPVPLVELLRTNDPTRLSWLDALFADAGIPMVVMDTHTALMEGSISAIQRRVMVSDDDLDAARRLLADAEDPGAPDAAEGSGGGTDPT